MKLVETWARNINTKEKVEYPSQDPYFNFDDVEENPTEDIGSCLNRSLPVLGGSGLQFGDVKQIPAKPGNLFAV